MAARVYIAVQGLCIIIRIRCADVPRADRRRIGVTAVNRKLG